MVDGERQDVERFVAQLQASHTRMRALAVRVLNDVDGAEDVLQVAYAKAFTSRDGYRGDAQFSTWLYRIVFRCCIDAQRRIRPVVGLEHVVDKAESHAAGNRFTDVVDDRLRLHQALGELSPTQRAVVWLIDAQGYSYKEAAEMLDLAPGTVASNVVRARAALRKVLERDGEVGNQ